MSVELWNDSEVFTLRIYKRLAQRQDLVWANTYELTALGPGGGADTAREAVRLVAEWERGLHLSDVQYDRGVFSSYVEDGQPYNPASFLSEPLTEVNGGRPIGVGGEPLALQLCLLVRREVSFGRNGRSLYRRCLREDDITAVAGDPVLDPTKRTEFDTKLTAVFAFNGFTADIGSHLAALNLGFVMANGSGVGSNNRRGITRFSAAGVTVKKYNNRYFDRQGIIGPA